MSMKPNYFKLGLFILTALVLLVVGIILFGSGIFEKEKIYFETYFKNPVTGLKPGAPVLDQGVKIGTVEKISFVRNDYSLPETTEAFSPFHTYVRVVCSVNSANLPELSQSERQKKLDVYIEHGLRLQLSTNILTGQGTIEASYLEPERFPLEELPWKPMYIYIPSAPSSFVTLKDSVDKILHRLEEIETEKIAENLNHVLTSIDKAVNDANVAAVSDQIESLFAEARQTNQDLKALLGTTTSEKDLTNIAELVDQLDTTLARIDQLNRTQSPQIVEILENFQQITYNLKILTEDLKKNPSQLIFSQPPKKESGQ